MQKGAPTIGLCVARGSGRPLARRRGLHTSSDAAVGEGRLHRRWERTRAPAVRGMRTRGHRHGCSVAQKVHTRRGARRRRRTRCSCSGGIRSGRKVRAHRRRLPPERRTPGGRVGDGLVAHASLGRIPRACAARLGRVCVCTPRVPHARSHRRCLRVKRLLAAERVRGGGGGRGREGESGELHGTRLHLRVRLRLRVRTRLLLTVPVLSSEHLGVGGRFEGGICARAHHPLHVAVRIRVECGNGSKKARAKELGLRN
mmetsp:Transcript_20381/g.64349  ORF Transcript_20381/g.64349 Transcript_20381/m.64349 type:complete len:257 (-) Transcript_20381:2036-2806(-)